VTVLQDLIAPETAGDPMSEQKWVRSSLRQLSTRLKEAGHPVSPPTVGRLLDQLGYALHVNAKKLEASAAHADRNEQFEHIAMQRQAFQGAHLPIISVDTKKKELIGNFKNAGQAWGQEAEAVNVHDFLHDALGRAVPYGIYDLRHNRGTVYVGTSADTPQFAVAAIACWWESSGRMAFPQADQLLILADAGGSNGCRPRLWKQQLQEQLSDRFGLTITVCHYPTGCSKWNPIEHRLFSHISLNWAGKPLRSWEIMLAYLRGTSTSTGLEVQAFLCESVYATGQSVSDTDMQTLNLERHAVCPNWNYTIRPRLADTFSGAADSTSREVVF
jgi:Rhodopirellula transposase DDE domain